MTEEELYKKLNYIFGNNCLSEDVHRCDFDGSCESHEKVEFLKLIEEYSKQIRADVIDEILKSDLCEHDEDWDYPCITPSYLWERLTQLKE